MWRARPILEEVAFFWRYFTLGRWRSSVLRALGPTATLLRRCFCLAKSIFITGVSTHALVSHEFCPFVIFPFEDLLRKCILALPVFLIFTLKQCTCASSLGRSIGSCRFR